MTHISILSCDSTTNSVVVVRRYPPITYLYSELWLDPNRCGWLEKCQLGFRSDPTVVRSTLYVANMWTHEQNFRQRARTLNGRGQTNVHMAGLSVITWCIIKCKCLYLVLLALDFRPLFYCHLTYRMLPPHTARAQQLTVLYHTSIVDLPFPESSCSFCGIRLCIKPFPACVLKAKIKRFQQSKATQWSTRLCAYLSWYHVVGSHAIHLLCMNYEHKTIPQASNGTIKSSRSLIKSATSFTTLPPTSQEWKVRASNT